MIEELKLLGVQELTEPEQRAAVGGGDGARWLGKILGWIGGAIANAAEAWHNEYVLMASCPGSPANR